jgi:ABC-2 type transport system permease protein
MVVLCIVVGPMFGPSLGLPGWLLDVSPFTHVPNAPATPIAGGPVLGLGTAALAFGAVAVLALRRRNLALPA